MVSRLHRSIFYSGVERYGNACLFLASTAVLSRLLRPEEFGIYAAVVALTSVATACSQEFGGANYLIQKPTLSEQDIRAAFTITLCLAALLAAVFFGLRNALAAFYSETRLSTGIGIFAGGLLVMPFVTTISSLLRREMAFDTLARCNLTAAFVATAMSIGLALLGWSFLALLIGSLVGQLVAIALLINSRPNLRIFRPSFAGWRDVVGFGAYSSAVVIINTIHQSWPQLILGRILDFAAVGLYGRAAGAIQLYDKLFLGVLSPVIMPAIAARKRAGVDLKRLYLQAVEILTAAQWPFLIFLALMAEPIVRLWFGGTWIAVVPLVRLLCLASLSLFAACLTYPILVATGRVRDTLFTSLISLPPTLAVMLAASFFGIRAVAASAFLTLPFQAAVAIYFVRKQLGFRLAELLRAMSRSSIVTACSCVGPAAAIACNHFSFALSAGGLVAAGIAGLIGWYVGLLLARHPLLTHLRSLTSSILPALPRARLARLTRLPRSPANSA